MKFLSSNQKIPGTNDNMTWRSPLSIFKIAMTWWQTQVFELLSFALTALRLKLNSWKCSICHIFFKFTLFSSYFGILLYETNPNYSRNLWMMPVNVKSLCVWNRFEKFKSCQEYNYLISDELIPRHRRGWSMFLTP